MAIGERQCYLADDPTPALPVAPLAGATHHFTLSAEHLTFKFEKGCAGGRNAIDCLDEMDFCF